MGHITASLPEIDLLPDSIFVMYEKCEKRLPFHTHSKGQLSYVEGGLAYIQVAERTYLIPARHYFWMPAGVRHNLTAADSATHLRSIFFNTRDDHKNEFYNKIGIYPINELLLQMFIHSQKWAGHVMENDEKYLFLKVIKNILPEISTRVLPMALPHTENTRMLEIIKYMEDNLSEQHSIATISKKFNFSARSLSRFFKTTLDMSFLQYLKLLRMAKAFELIVKNNHSLEDIAYQTGYQSLSSFSSTFYQVTSFRPSDFINVKNVFK
ncbi:AraC family transcriptional regulator [Niastella yeongjuensis]|uniref:AraC family transcriptional regulator n=1 Tax=Niastella yeongjuensis TaxID=354355 RepID=A0A1V9E3L9_9BACT|nr:AraC family transcriptional regulator [Niastella yeongjuensis]OQP40727.1 AraC family transcriptional regulator [Niastella yeongjuensis]SEP03486.1 AraC-like ligand binding domain-containing protein [Niastella yeongjuensis]